MRILILILNVLGFWLMADAAHADPITAAIAAISQFIGSVGVIGKLVLTVAINIGLSLVEKALAKKDQPQQAGAKLEISMGDDHPMSFIIGSYATAGRRKYAGSWGEDGKTPNAYFTDVIEVGNLPNYAGERGLTSVWIDDQQVGVLWEEPHPDGRGFPVLQYRVKGKDYLWIKFLDGTQSSADAFLTAKFGANPDRPWKPTMVGLGCQVVILTARYNTDLFSGIPAGLYQPHPVPLYDIRKDSSVGGNGTHRWDSPASWEPTSNPAVMIYNLARGVYRGSEWVYGGQNIAAFCLPAANWMAAANACDASVTLDNGSSEPAFRAGYEVQCDQQPLDVISELLKGCNGRMAEVGGIFKVLISTPGGAVYSFSDDDIIVTEEQDFQPFPSLSDTYNAIEATYPEPSEKWATKDAPGRYNADLEAQDGNRRLPAQIQLPAVPFANQVQRVGLAMIQDYRRFRVHQISLPPDAYPLEPNDVVSWTSARNGYDEKKFLVVKVEPQPNFLIVVTLKEVDPADYDWHSGLQLPTATGWLGPITPPSQPMVGWTVEPATVKDAGGIDRRPAIKISCAADMDDVERVWVQVRLKETGDIVFDSDSTRYASPFSWVISGQWMLSNTDYEARGRYIPKSNRATDWSAWLAVKTPNVLIQSGDVLDGAIIASKIADAAVTAEKIMDEAVTNLKLADAAVSTAKLQVAAVTNQILADSSVISSKLADAAITASKIAGQAVDATKFASSIKPVEIVSTLPATGNVEGRQVYLTTDGKLYRYHNSAWTAAVAATDVSGQLQSAQLADLAVTAAKIADGTISATKIADAAITNAKLGPLAVDASKLADSAITTTKIADNAISTPKLQANAVVANNIAANAVTARNLVIQDWENLIPDNQLQSSDSWFSRPANAVVNPVAAQAFNSKGSLDYTYVAGAGYQLIVQSDALPIVPGQEYLVSGQAFRTSGTKMGAWARVHWTDATGQVLNPDVYTTIFDTSGGTTASGMQTYTVTMIPPANAFGAILRIYVQRDNTDGNISFGGFSFLRKASANLIVDGAITATKLAANSVAAASIAANAVTTKSIAIGDFANMITNPFFDQGAAGTDGWVLGGGIAPSRIVGASGDPAPNYIRIPDANGAIDYAIFDPELVITGSMPCSAGDSYYVEFYIRKNGAPTAPFGCYLSVSDRLSANTVWPQVYFANAADVPTVWTKVQALVNIPAAVASSGIPARFNLQLTARPGTASNGGSYDIAKPALRKATGAVMIEDGAVTANKIAANAVTTGSIAAGAVSASQLAASAVTADKIAANAVTTNALAVGSGKNLLQNAGFTMGTDCWAVGFNSGTIPGQVFAIRQWQPGGWAGPNSPTLFLYHGAPTGNNYYCDVRWLRPDAPGLAGNLSYGMPCAPGDWFEVSAYVSAHRCLTELRIQWIAADGSAIGYTTANQNNGVAGSSTNPDLWTRLRCVGQAPANAVAAAIHFRKYETDAGQADSYMFINKPMLCRCPANASEFTPWSDGGTVMITSGGIVAGAITAAKIAAATITATQLAAGSVTAAQLAAGSVTAAAIAAATITGAKIAADTIGASNIAADAITAKQLVLTDFSNIADNGWGAGSLDGWTVQGKQAFYFESSAGDAAGWVLQSLGRDCAMSNPIAVTAGESYFFDVWVYNTDTNTANLFAQLTSPSGTQSWQTVASTTVKNAWTRLQGKFTVPTGWVKLQVDLQVARTNGTGSSCYWSKPVLRRATNAEMIVDGSVTANKISVNSLDALTANLGAVNISSAVIGTLQVGTSNISGGAVTGVGVGRVAGTQNISANATVNLVSCVVNVAGDGRVVIDAMTLGQYNQNGGSQNSQPIGVNIFRDGTAIFSQTYYLGVVQTVVTGTGGSNGSTTQTTYTAGLVAVSGLYDAPGAGNHTYILQIYCPGNTIGWNESNITATALKR
ncbi:phage tail protein [Rhizobium sp. CB3090]|uniref:phage tail protein n=1 Tax=Rhizobium sp. CB3090 TaxID=3039156 RepID=UPI0024B1307F|nr:phage tail protein [Rhizobium sp. CB3090]WFU07636.1 phage tail protein [Rhizobium sp. CB3090]